MAISAIGALVFLVASGAAAGTPEQERQAAAIESELAPNAVEGSHGTKRIFRSGCYQRDSRGPTKGGVGHDVEAGCASASSFAELFAQVDVLLAEGGLAPEKAAPASRGALGPSAAGNLPRSIVIDARGRRLAPKDARAATRLAAIVSRAPTLAPWYVTPPMPPAGAGPQLVVLSARAGKRPALRTLQASLVATGEWWCYLSVPDDGAEHALPRAPNPLAPAKAAAILERVLAGISARALAEARAAAKPTPGGNDSLSVEAAVGAGPRTFVYAPSDLAIVKRFGAEARALATACRVP